MKLFTTSTIAQIDKYTIEYEPIADIDLMERAASKIFEYIENSKLKGNIVIFCGPGNNGGDGLALARMISTLSDRFNVSVYLFNFGRSFSNNTQINLERLSSVKNVSLRIIVDNDSLPDFINADIVVDALFGSGLNRPLMGFAAQIAAYINRSGAYVISVDIPSGLMGEDNRENEPGAIVKADCTLTFQFPKISFLFAENELYTGEWHVLDIGLHRNAINSISSSFYFIDEAEIKLRIKRRNKFSHKGTYGHALLIAGAYGKMGAAVLAAKASLRAGAGLLTVHVPHSTYQIIQTAVPEAMCDIDDSDLMFSGAGNVNLFSAVGVGPAIGQKVNTQRGLKRLLCETTVPMVIDADAINILGLNQDWLSDLKEGSILTPHPKEFDRIAGPSDCAYQRMTKAVEMSQSRNIIVIVKGAHTLIACPDGTVWFNSTGNPGMATAGSGDVLTGIILGLLSQGYSPIDSSIIGVYVHGLAGDLAKLQMGENSLIASDIIAQMGEAFKKFE